MASSGTRTGSPSGGSGVRRPRHSQRRRAAPALQASMALPPGGFRSVRFLLPKRSPNPPGPGRWSDGPQADLDVRTQKVRVGRHWCPAVGEQLGADAPDQGTEEIPLARAQAAPMILRLTCAARLGPAPQRELEKPMGPHRRGRLCDSPSREGGPVPPEGLAGPERRRGLARCLERKPKVIQLHVAEIDGHGREIGHDDN